MVVKLVYYDYISCLIQLSSLHEFNNYFFSSPLFIVPITIAPSYSLNRYVLFSVAFPKIVKGITLCNLTFFKMLTFSLLYCSIV